MSSKKLIITAVISYIVFLLILLPAAQIFPFLKIPASTASFSGISGSIWSGRIDRVRLQKQNIHAVQWDVKPLSLLTGTLSADILSSYQNIDASTLLDYSLFSKKLSLSDLRSEFSASQLQKLLELPFAELTGSIHMDMNSIVLQQNKLSQVNGQIIWNDAKVKISKPIALGILNVDVSTPKSGELSAILSNRQGALSIQGKLKLMANSRYTLDVRLKPRANAPSELTDLLRLIAPKKIKSEHVIQRSGRLKASGLLL